MCSISLDIERAFGTVYDMVRTRVRWGRVGALAATVGLAVTLVAGAASAGAAPGAPTGRPERVHIVRSGDTLWAIAARIAGPEADPRPLVDAIAARNAVTGPIHPGQAIVVPAAG